jgi:hypothetical protein
VDRARLATVLERQALHGMQRPALGTAAGRPATADVEDTEGSGQAGCATGQLLQAAVEQTADERRVIRDAHGYPRYVAVKERSEAYKKKGPIVPCEKRRNRVGALSTSLKIAFTREDLDVA